ncbi:PilZ domain-containing protein [Desulfohalovibrio reitneri]|uniref:PilZ domain-containing protein n=1 Tax=Desulfohalovibrio reitneri TaxID=1307759 RepID=UPI001376FE8D|nr:PilZ domain-containing protein [Desulfohalovibrio reitneri]
MGASGTRNDAAARRHRVVLVAEDGPARLAYLSALETLGAAFSTVEDLGEMRGLLAETPVSGLLVDVPTLVKAPPGEKRLLHYLLEHFPVLRLRFDDTEQTIHGLFHGRVGPGTDILRDFLALEADAFAPRTLRAAGRDDVHFNVLVSRSPDMDNPVRAVTTNVSPGGCFISTCDDCLQVERLWLRVSELSDGTPIEVSVRWRQPWGVRQAIPGIGVAFVNMTSAQAEELDSWLLSTNDDPEIGRIS